MRAEILCVGTELLIGQTVNTNATFLAQGLAALGIDCYWMSTVGDNFARLQEAIATAWGRADLVLMTGGLGPTADDITVEAIARFLGEPLEERAEARAHVEALFAARKRVLVPSNYKQALFPPTAGVIPNPTGTAMGCHVARDGKQIMAFPGVPFELKQMWREWAEPRLAKAGGGMIRSVLLKYTGIGEAMLAEQVAGYLERSNPTVAPYAANGEVHLRVTAKAGSPEECDRLLAPVVAELSALAPHYYGRDEQTLPSVVGDRLLARGQSVGLAESCTGGLLASRLTDIPGASRYVRGGVVCYDTALKVAMLGVPEAMIEAEGVVSRAVAERLATGAREALVADWGVGVTGWASGGPGVPEADAGLVWVAVAGPDGDVEAREARYGARTPREMVKYFATQAALDLLRQRLGGSASA
jgi:nicotinamide-nucleotide amidase